MRTARIVEAGAAYYHVLSRVVDRRFVFDEGEKERFRKTMRQCRVPFESVPVPPANKPRMKAGVRRKMVDKTYTMRDIVRHEHKADITTG